MLFYLPVEETLYISELGHYRSYGIRVENETGETVAFLSDVSPDLALVSDLAERCTKGQLAPEHLRDVVLDTI